MLRGLGGYMAERATDLYDVRDRAICELRGLPEPGVPAFDGPVVLVAHDLAPAETATLDPDTVLGIITEVGGPTSHTAILAAQLGIPAIVKAAGIMGVAEGTMLALDGGVGEVIIAPTDDEVDLLKERSRRRALALAGSTGKGATYDGYPVKLLANIGTVDDAMKASKFDLEGSGLFRTEFLFLERSEAPTLEEQTDTYTKVLQAFGDRRVPRCRRRQAAELRGSGCRREPRPGRARPAPVPGARGPHRYAAAGSGRRPQGDGRGAVGHGPHGLDC